MMRTRMVHPVPVASVTCSTQQCHRSWHPMPTTHLSPSLGTVQPFCRRGSRSNPTLTNRWTLMPCRKWGQHTWRRVAARRMKRKPRPHAGAERMGRQSEARWAACMECKEALWGQAVLREGGSAAILKTGGGGPAEGPTHCSFFTLFWRAYHLASAAQHSTILYTLLCTGAPAPAERQAAHRPPHWESSCACTLWLWP